MGDRTGPASSRWLTTPAARIHHVEAGTGPCVLLLHGNPTWSFLYRGVAAALWERCRVVAPDYPGFGRSVAGPGYGYDPREHAREMDRLVAALRPGPFVLVGHDWGGPIGLAVARRRPAELLGIVLCNTWCWRPDPWLRLFSRAVDSPPGRWGCERFGLFERFLLPLAIHRRDAVDRSVLEAYAAPFRDGASRRATWIFARSIRTAAGWIEATARSLGPLRDVPVELVWGRRDPLLGRERYVARWRRIFPGAAVTWLEDAGHYVPEERPDAVAAAVGRALTATCRGEAGPSGGAPGGSGRDEP